MARQFRRIVTGHNFQGKACVIFDGIAESVRIPIDEPKVAMTDFWYSDEMPVSNAGNADVTKRPIILQPRPNGSTLRIIELPPDSERTYCNLIGIGSHGDIREMGKRHPGFHKTNTMDYIFVIEGEVTCLLDETDVHLKSGDVLIQRGTSHAWSNRGDKPCLLLAVLLDAKPE